MVSGGDNRAASTTPPNSGGEDVKVRVEY